MLALASVWIALITFILAGTMLVYRPAMTDLTVTFVLYFGSPGALCFAGLVLWAHRDDDCSDPGLQAQRLQAKIAIGLAIIAAGILYYLIINSQKIEPIEPTSATFYNPPGDVPRWAMPGTLEAYAGYHQRPVGIL